MIIIGASQSGALKLAFISHTWYAGDAIVALTPATCPEAYHHPAILRSATSAIIIRTRGQFVVLDAMPQGEGLIHQAKTPIAIEITRRVQLSPAIWTPIRHQIFIAAGWLSK